MVFSKTSLFFFLIFVINSCDNSNNDKREKELLQKELVQKEKELSLQKEEWDFLKKQDSIRSIKKPENQSLADTYERVKSSVYLILTTDDISVSQGSAFIINERGDAISNYHVFENASKAIAINGEGKKFFIEKIYVFDKLMDYIIFKIGPSSTEFNPLKIANTESRIGEECFAIGNPYGLTRTLSSGIISGYREDKNKIQITAEITHGSSGGPLFNKEGEVIGITSGGFGQADLNFAINIKSLPLNNYYNIPLSDNTVEVTDFERQKLKNSIDNYFNAIVNQDYNSLLKYYTDTLDRYYKKFNMSAYDVIKSDEEYNTTKGIFPKAVQIDWSSLKIARSDLGYSINIKIHYSIVRREINKPREFNLEIFLEFTNEYRIRSVFENILSKF